MTKHMLTEFLRPFDDNIEIVIEEDMAQVIDLRPRYKVAGRGPDSERMDDNSLEHQGIAGGEGYILL